MIGLIITLITTNLVLVLLISVLERIARALEKK